MKTVVTDVQSWKKRIEVEVDYQEVRPYLDKAIRKYQKKISLDGFRKGKVPLSIIKKRFGDAIQAEISEELIQIFFKKAVEEEDLAIVAPGSVEDVTFEENLPFRFIVEVEVEPEITVSNYKILFSTNQSQKPELIEMTKIPGRKKTFFIKRTRRLFRIVPIVAKKILASYLHLADHFVIIFPSASGGECSSIFGNQLHLYAI